MIKNKVVRTSVRLSPQNGGFSDLEKAFGDGWTFKTVSILNDGGIAEYILEKDIDEEEEDGVWLDNTDGFGCKFTCSKCSSGTNFKHIFCPSCGKHMKKNSFAVGDFTPEGGY